MKVILAGYNVDTEALKSYKHKKIILTPESISAAYARISRSPKPVNVLRQEARKEVAKARKSNQRIIFEMGHHSVAEHAVFNFDIIDISRRAIEELEKFRLCSYTEKSQRYVTLKGDFVIPQEIKKTNLLDEYLQIIKIQNDFYKYLFEKIKKHYLRKSPDLANKENIRRLENLAKEDARYILSLATQTQVGTTINARNLELMIRRFASHRLSEINELGENFFNLVKKIAPSIILFFKANDYNKKTYPELKEYAKRYEVKKLGSYEDKDVDLIDYTKDGDDKILAALLFKVSNKNYIQCLNTVQKMSKRQKIDFFKKSCQYMELYDFALRELEFAHLTYSLIVSAGCFGQLKRHRMATITCQGYDPSLGITIPEVVKQVGEEKRFVEIIKETEKVYERIEKRLPGIGSYVLTNAHQKRVLLNVNLRELYHISRLREDIYAQWDIREKCKQMSNLAKGVMPITTRLLGSKPNYPGIYYKLFGTYPKVTEVPPIK